MYICANEGCINCNENGCVKFDAPNIKPVTGKCLFHAVFLLFDSFNGKPLNFRFLVYLERSLFLKKVELKSSF